MDTAIFYSDTAIIIYELIVIAVMAFFIKKLSREKKEIMLSDSKYEEQMKEDHLKQQLANDRRR